MREVWLEKSSLKISFSLKKIKAVKNIVQRKVPTKIELNNLLENGFKREKNFDGLRSFTFIGYCILVVHDNFNSSGF